MRGSAVTVYETRRKLWDLLPSESLEIECSDAESDDASESLFCAGAKKMSTRVPLYGDFCVWRFYMRSIIFYVIYLLSLVLVQPPHHRQQLLMKKKISLLAFLRCGCKSSSIISTRLYESNPVSYWTGRDCNKKLAFRHTKPCELGGGNVNDNGRSNSTVLFLNGLLSTMNGTKCNALQRHCNKNGVSFLCFD